MACLIKVKCKEGDDINVSFDKPLRDYQEHIIGVYMNHIGEPIAKNHTQNGNGGILEVPCGRGKCLSKDTPIMMFDGSIKMVQDESEIKSWETILHQGTY